MILSSGSTSVIDSSVVEGSIVEVSVREGSVVENEVNGAVWEVMLISFKDKYCNGRILRKNKKYASAVFFSKRLQ
jgi:hypothetical protein